MGEHEMKRVKQCLLLIVTGIAGVLMLIGIFNIVLALGMLFVLLIIGGIFGAMLYMELDGDTIQ